MRRSSTHRSVCERPNRPPPHHRKRDGAVLKGWESLPSSTYPHSLLLPHIGNGHHSRHDRAVSQGSESLLSNTSFSLSHSRISATAKLANSDRAVLQAVSHSIKHLLIPPRISRTTDRGCVAGCAEATAGQPGGGELGAQEHPGPLLALGMPRILAMDSRGKELARCSVYVMCPPTLVRVG